MGQGKQIMSGTRQLQKGSNRTTSMAKRMRCPKDKTLTVPHRQINGATAQRCPKCLTVYRTQSI